MTDPHPASLDTITPYHPDTDQTEKPFPTRKRIAVLGAHGVGKTAVSIQCVMNRFEAEYMLTFEDTYQWKPQIDGILYNVSIVDTEGQDENSFFGPQYTIGVDGYILMFSVRDESSFEIVKAVNDKLLDTLNVFSTKGTAEVPRILVGNQIDLADERQVPFMVAKQYADDQRIPYFETSAFTAHNVTTVFAEVLRIIHTNLRQSHAPIPLQSDQNKQKPSPTNNFCLVQ